MRTISQILTNDDNIISIDFPFNIYRQKHDSFFRNKEHELDIRYNNLKTIINVFNDNKINYWLQGKTLLGIYKYNKLIENDSDEDIGTDIKNLEIVCSTIIPSLKKLGFKVIRATANNSMVTVMKDNRYIDICFFKQHDDIYYYEKKKFPKKFFEKFINHEVNNFTYIIPEKSNEICKYSYNL